MKCSGSHLHTPLYLKLDVDTPLPENEKAYYLLTGNGLFLCRNHEFFRSCVPTQHWPGELAGQKPFLLVRYPKIPRLLLEQVIGFFDLIGERYASEATVLIAWSRRAQAVEVLVPDQVGLVGTTRYGDPFPIEVQYEVPTLPPHLTLIGDIHSHVDGPAYASYKDKNDEVHRPGIHMVIGRIQDEPPEFHCELIADGVRFPVRDLSLVLEGYHRRRCEEVPQDWIDKVTVKPWRSSLSTYSYSNTNPLPTWNMDNVIVEAEADDRTDPHPSDPQPSPARKPTESNDVP
jgi:hypothetical protein